MFRRVITALLLIATVTGPQWCCCPLRAAMGETSAAIAHRPPAVRKSCCARKPSSDPAKRSPADNRSCPCREHDRNFLNAGGKTEIVQSPRSADGVRQMLLLDASTCTAHSAAATDTRAPAPDSAPAKLSGTALLRAYHILRC